VKSRFLFGIDCVSNTEAKNSNEASECVLKQSLLNIREEESEKIQAQFHPEKFYREAPTKNSFREISRLKNASRVNGSGIFRDIKKQR
jgi:hypothetical protein